MPDWKDTVIQPESLAACILMYPDLPMGQAIAKRQAEISYRAGEQQAYDKGYSQAKADRFFVAEEHRKEGRREVVEWIKSRWISDGILHTIGGYWWQAKLKEWGIEESDGT